MNSQTTPPAMPGPGAAMLQNATIDKAEGSEFSNTARDMFKFVLNYNQHIRSAVPTGAEQAVENQTHEFHDVIKYLLNIAPLVVEEVRKNDQSRSESAVGSNPLTQAVTTDHTPHSSVLEDPVDIIDMVPSEPSLLPVANIADRYTRSMLKCLVGYPLYDPKPLSELSKEYLHNGVNVGDVGFVWGTGTFDFLFNICPSKNGSINPPNLPDGFSLETPDHSATVDPLPRNTCLFQSPITKTSSGEYICEGSEGAILELPEGAIQDDAMNALPFANLAARHGVRWYEYTMTRGRDISNGSLYLITSFTKCAQWGIAVFDRPCCTGQGLRFDKKRSLPFGKSTSKYHWKGSRVFPSKVSNLKQGDAPNQCVLLRGYKIMIRQDIFDNLRKDQSRRSDLAIRSLSPQAGSSRMTRQPATRIRGGGGPDPISRLTGKGLLSRTTMAKSDSSEEVVLHPNFNSSLVHPSDLINAALLSQNPGAKVALTHDDVWCNLLRDNFPKINYATLINIARSYTNTVDEYDCVSLEKICDSSNVLDESSRPLQGTEALAFQGPLITPDDDYSPVPATISLTLPRELMERILLLLGIESMLKCRRVNREFNEIIQSSTSLQYFLACKAADVIDNPQSPLSYAERLEALKKREEAWRKLRPVFETTIKVNGQPSFYELAAGNFLLCDKDRKDLHYCHLPSSPQDNLQWIRIPGHGLEQSWSGFIVDIVTAICEHDLIVNIICSEVGNQADMQRHSIDVILLKFSTGEYHPLARHPRIHVQRCSARLYLVPEIMGDNLALIVRSPDNAFPDKLYIFDWKTGHKRLQHEATGYAYSDLAFISPELLLVPNCIKSHFEIWHLPPSDTNPNPPVQILSLKLPAVSDGYHLLQISCYGEHIPFLHSMPYFPPRPFFPSMEDSTIIFNLIFESLTAPTQSIYTLIMHRRALLDMIQRWTSPSLFERVYLPWLTNEVTVHKVADLDDGSVRLCAQSKLVEDPESSPQTRSSTASSTSRYDIVQVQWADWGPRISRWFQEKSGWIRQSTGQRYVFLDPNPRDRTKCMVNVVDFNPHNVRRNAEVMARLRGEGEDNGGNGNNEKKEEELEILDHEGVFSEEMYMGLKCVVHHMPGEYDFDRVLMDEERLFGLKFDRERRVESIKVLYFG